MIVDVSRACFVVGEGGVSLGKGAWDCDKKCEIAPEKEVGAPRQQGEVSTTLHLFALTTGGMCLLAMQAEEFEEIATMDYPFEGIPTVPPRKDMDRMVGGPVSLPPVSSVPKETLCTWNNSCNAHRHAVADLQFTQ